MTSVSLSISLAVVEGRFAPVKDGQRARHGKKAELTGGVILILLGLKILLEHLDIL